MENDTFDIDVVQCVAFFQNFLQMPGNCLTLAVRIGRQIQVIRALYGFFDRLQVFFRLGVDQPDHPEIVVRLDRAVL